MTERLENTIARIKLMFLLGHSVIWNLILLLVIVCLYALIVYMCNFMCIHICLYVINISFIFIQIYVNLHLYNYPSMLTYNYLN